MPGNRFPLMAYARCRSRPKAARCSPRADGTSRSQCPARNAISKPTSARAGSTTSTLPAFLRMQAREDVVGERQKSLMTQRRRNQVLEMNLLAQPRDLIDDALRRAMNDDAVDIALQRISLGADSFRIHVGTQQPLRTLARDGRGFGIGGSDRDQPRDGNFAARDRMAVHFE